MVLPIAITMGCPAGIGPEIILKALSSTPGLPHVVVIGDLEILKRARDFAKIGELEFSIWHPGEHVSQNQAPKVVHVYPVTNLSTDQILPGKPSAETGKASFAYLDTAIDLCLTGKASAIVTAPISKIGLKLAGYNWPGHTEILAARTKSSNFLMMMAGTKLNVTLVTIHVPISQVPSLITIDNILMTIQITCKALKRDFAILNPRIAVCGLNPHAGEGGMFGTEEIDIIEPACQKARASGLDIEGPLPPDTVFYQASHGDFDAVVCLYHDQGLIPFKLLHFDDGVNVTLGLPIVRTSVDHGTAYDIAGTGKANPSSLESAMRLAAKIVSNRANFHNS